MASTFKLSSTFASNMQLLRDGIQDAATAAMERTMRQAEQDANQLYRWHTPGEYTGVGSNGDIWTWVVTGASAASITAYVVPNKRIKANNPGQATTIEREVSLGRHSMTKTYTHEHGLDPSLTGDYQEQPGKVIGAVTMYTAYAPYLQQKEIKGGVWGSPSPGEPVTIDVLDVYWEPYYCPHIIAPTIERWMQRVAAQLR